MLLVVGYKWDQKTVQACGAQIMSLLRHMSSNSERKNGELYMPTISMTIAYVLFGKLPVVGMLADKYHRRGHLLCVAGTICIIGICGLRFIVMIDTASIYQT